MSYEQKPGSGSLFKNDKKTEDKHPDYKGSAMMLDGSECWVSAWVKRPEGKQPFMSLSFQLKDATKAVTQVESAVPIVDDLPF